jgi:hypothetical protein
MTTKLSSNRSLAMRGRRSKWVSFVLLVFWSGFFFLAHLGYLPVSHVLPSFMTFQWNQGKGGSSLSLSIAAVLLFSALTFLGQLLFERKDSS